MRSLMIRVLATLRQQRSLPVVFGGPRLRCEWSLDGRCFFFLAAAVRFVALEDDGLYFAYLAVAQILERGSGRGLGRWSWSWSLELP